MATTQARSLSVSVTPRRQALLGLGSVGIILAGALATALVYRGHAGEVYSPLNHFISELGEIATSRLAWVFNLSVLIGGIGLGTFMLLLAGRLDGHFRVALIAAGLAAGASGALVGVYPMNYLITHRIVSTIFFLTSWLVAAIFSLWLIVTPRPGLPRWLIVPGAVAVTISLAFVAVYSTYHPADPDGPIVGRPDVLWTVPLLEWVSLLSLLIWFVCVSVALLREGAE